MTRFVLIDGSKQATRIAVVIFALSLAVLLIASARSPLGGASSEYAALVNQAEELVRDAAHDGVLTLGQPERQNALRQLSTRPLAPLLSAWSALSLGRSGVLGGATCVRLPWLILAGILPAAVFMVLLESRGPQTAVGAAIWLLFSPGFIGCALVVCPSGLSVWSGWLVVAAYATSLNARGGRARCAAALACGAIFLVALGLDYGAAWLIPFLLAHFLVVRRRELSAVVARGQVSVPVAVLAIVVALPMAIVAFDPVLWHADVPGIIRRLAADDASYTEQAPRLAPLLASAAVGLVGMAALAERGLARRFATGEFRPARDRAGVALLLALGLFTATSCAVLGGARRAEFAADLARPFLACVVAVGAAALAGRLFKAQHARIVEATVLLALLLVR